MASPSSCSSPAWDSPSGLKHAQDAAARLGIKLPTVRSFQSDVPVRSTPSPERPDALFVYPDPIASMRMRAVVDFALRRRLPSMFAFRDFVGVGEA